MYSSWRELADKKLIEPRFWINPYVVDQGITFFWGPTSSGKSAVSWAMAAAIGSGTAFFGLPVTQGKVLYVEVDSPEPVVASRIRKLPTPENVWFLVSKPLTVPQVAQREMEALFQAQEELRPDVVVLNTLRKLSQKDDKDSATPIIIYGFFQKLFPQAALIFVHHTRKTSTDPRATERDAEDFSGSQHHLDDAQVGIKLERGGSRVDDGTNLYLKHFKSQVSPKLRALPLKLWDDGSTLTSPLYERYLGVYTLLGELDTKGTSFDKEASLKLQLGESTIYKIRKDIEAGKFPDSRRWLEKLKEDEE